VPWRVLYEAQRQHIMAVTDPLVLQL
jgi:hypothetical protein